MDFHENAWERKLRPVCFEKPGKKHSVMSIAKSQHKTSMKPLDIHVLVLDSIPILTQCMARISKDTAAHGTPKIRNTFFWALIVRMLVFGGLYWGHSMLRDYPITCLTTPNLLFNQVLRPPRSSLAHLTWLQFLGNCNRGFCTQYGLQLWGAAK